MFLDDKSLPYSILGDVCICSCHGVRVMYMYEEG